MLAGADCAWLHQHETHQCQVNIKCRINLTGFANKQAEKYNNQTCQVLIDTTLVG
jgi:hypothetical protein